MGTQRQPYEKDWISFKPRSPWGHLIGAIKDFSLEGTSIH